MDTVARLLGLWWWSPLGRLLTFARLRRVGDPQATAVADAVRRARRQRFDPDERLWLERIAALRDDLSRDQRRLADTGEDGPSALDTAEMATADRGTVSEVYDRTAVTPERAHLLFTLVRALRPGRCLEMGTGLGVSALYLAAALELNGTGELVTMEGSQARVGIARRNLGQIGLAHRADLRVGVFARTLPGILEERPVDVAFVDGHHKEGPTVDYFERVVAGTSGTVVLVFDDIAWSWGMRRAWRRIVDDEHIVAHADIGPVGITVARALPDPA